MSDRVHLPRVALDSMLPGWSFWPAEHNDVEARGAGDRVAVRCAHCETMGILEQHSIEPNGEVNASIFCCEAGHIFAVLDGWPENLRKNRGKQVVEVA